MKVVIPNNRVPILNSLLHDNGIYLGCDVLHDPVFPESMADRVCRLIAECTLKENNAFLFEQDEPRECRAHISGSQPMKFLTYI
jgi:hypothetical protein